MSHRPTAIMNRGDLWDIATIYDKTAGGQDDHGGPTFTYTTVLATRRVKVEYLRGTEPFRAGTVDATYDVAITMDDYPLESNQHQIGVQSVSTNRTVRYDIVWVEHVFDRGRKTIAYCRVGKQ